MSKVVLLDGGLGQELIRRAPEGPTPLWSVQVMIDHPELVEDVHRDYFEAGATVATTNSYMLHQDRLNGTPFENDRTDLIATALKAAQNALTSPSHRIAGAIGPLNATYRPDIHPDFETAVPLYADLAKHLAARVDLILCETVASVTHAEAILTGARQTNLPVWLSVTLDDEDGSRLRSGEHVSDLGHLTPDAWLANCSAPEAMAAALDVFAAFGKPYGAYANGFTEITKDFLKAKPTVDALAARDDVTPEKYAETVLSWVTQGATIVGGCCEIGPDHIREIATRLTAAGHTIV
ncbi:MAG: homocysteine S-methyltransferase family protein [Boseongicola sp.]|nr:homocysteine S-methyltransferase family protein [Boseongicola sp.]